MSLRAKLWILGLFLLLLTGPAIYVVLSWSPENPLRFRVIERYKLGSHDDDKNAVVLMEIENVSDFPVLFFGAHVWQTDVRKGTLGTLSPHYQFDPLIQKRGGFIAIGGLQRVRALAIMNSDWNTDRGLGEPKVAYLWVSKTEGRFMEARDAVEKWLPYRLRSTLPKSREGRDETILESPRLKDSRP